MKACDKCQDLTSIRYRVQYDSTKNWYLLCPQCWKLVSANNPHYRYGGTWKTKR
jgi:hypothetical protein